LNNLYTWEGPVLKTQYGVNLHAGGNVGYDVLGSGTDAEIVAIEKQWIDFERIEETN